MTVYGKSNENSNMNAAQSRNLVANRPSFMITDILSKAAAVEKIPPSTQTSQYLQHLERFSAMNHGFGMMIPEKIQSTERKDTFCDSDDDDFHGSDDVDGHSTDGSNHGKDDDLNESNRSGSLPSDRLIHKKQRKARTAFTDHQLHSMEKCFSRQKYLSVQDRMELANKLGISDTQVKTWFQNRRTKWKRQTAVGLELFVEAGNYAAYQRAYASRYGQMDAMPSYSGNPLMMPGAGHPIMPPSNLSSVESYYQQILQGSMNGIATPNMFAAPHRPLPMVPQIPGTAFLPLSPPNSLYSASRLPSTSPSQRLSPPEQPRPHSLSPVNSSLPSHSPKTSSSQQWPTKPQSTHNATDDESDIEV